MKKINIIKKNYDINRIINSKKSIKNKYFSIFYDDNKLDKNMFAICISTKVGNSVTRNKTKRRVKDIIDKSNLVFKNSVDYVIIIKKEINELNYQQMKENLINLFLKILD